jgi:hypothetical protein
MVKSCICLQNGLRDAVLDDFKMLLGSSDVKLTPDNIERLANACLVVNALGPKVGSSCCWPAGITSSVQGGELRQTAVGVTAYTVDLCSKRTCSACVLTRHQITRHMSVHWRFM